MTASMPISNESQSLAVQRSEFYYGWVNLLMASVAMTATLPGRTHGLALITKPLTDDQALHVGEVLFSHLNFWAVLIGAVFCLPIGRAIDRFGVRRMLTFVAAALGISVAAMSRSNDWLVLLITLTFVRGFGQGALSVVSMAMIGKWFTRRLGMAMGIFSVLLAIGFIATTLGTGGAVAAYGWRTTWMGIAACLTLGLAPLGYLTVRNSPESIGLPVDPLEVIPVDPERKSSDFTVWEALGSSTFWVFTFAASTFNLTWSSITLFQESLLADNGFNHDAFILVMGLLVASGLPANLLTGWLATRGRLGWLLSIGMFMLAGSLFAFPHLKSNSDLVLYGTALGVSGGIITVIFFTAYGQVFGRTNLGAIQGIVQSISVLASAVGPIIMTSMKIRGLTSQFFYISAITACGLGVLSLLVKSPVRAVISPIRETDAELA